MSSGVFTRSRYVIGEFSMYRERNSHGKPPMRPLLQFEIRKSAQLDSTFQSILLSAWLGDGDETTHPFERSLEEVTLVLQPLQYMRFVAIQDVAAGNSLGA